MVPHFSYLTEMKRGRFKTLQKIKFAAKIWGTAVLAFLLFFLIAHIIEDKNAVFQVFRDSETLTFLMFPLSSILGLTMALKWPGLGGLITVLGLAGLFVLRPDLAQSPIILFAILPPGILHLLYWKLAK